MTSSVSKANSSQVRFGMNSENRSGNGIRRRGYNHSAVHKKSYYTYQKARRTTYRMGCVSFLFVRIAVRLDRQAANGAVNSSGKAPYR